ncbi:MAG: TRAP transporter TatT component family protein [Gammaproteobacteria bacterium]|nr:TRAP transporter TatT component family protein [Gammaproteobacteria bacterium]MBU1653803.1 TRAP transporter TatT component family protein [Gammaproteobacteria bacterium]MBU1961715.1 TRAP transporter TatT component family protein [Gammaproteobacteria bacterium]
MNKRISLVLLSALLLAAQGCSSITERFSARIADKLKARLEQELPPRLKQELNRELGVKLDKMTGDLTTGMLNHNEPDTVFAGMPAYLILLESMLQSDPDNPKLLMAASKLYSAYAGSLVDQPERAKALSSRARDFAGKVLCRQQPGVCKLETLAYDKYILSVRKVGKADIEPLYAYGVAWATWLYTQTGDWGALAERPKIESIFQHLAKMDEGYDRGRVQLYLAVMNSQLTPALGGKPEVGRDHFEKALKHSGGEDLMVKVKYARHYTRLVLNKELHDRLLKEVLEADPQAPRLTLSNVMAQQEARKLKADGYFQE